VTVRTLRKDFPALSHQHPTPTDSPRILCLYNVAWSSVERAWTPERFLDRMFWWLRQSATQSLHRDDQPLEQLFYMSPYQLILPANHLEFAKGDNNYLGLQRVPSPPTAPITLRAQPATADELAQQGLKGLRVLPLMVEGVGSSEVVAFPTDLGQLHERLTAWRSNLCVPLAEAIGKAIPSEGLSAKNQQDDEGFLILVWVPRIRNGEVERHDILCYAVPTSLFELATAFEILGQADDHGRYFRTQLIGHTPGEPEDDAWRSIPVLPVEVRVAMDKERARRLSAIDSTAASFSGVLAGVGSLGGLLANLWQREAWGDWTYVDPDQLLPHNLPRHVGFDFGLGQAKVDVLQTLAQHVYPNQPVPDAIPASITERSDAVLAALAAADLLVDVTTTLDTPRDIAQRDEAPRTANLFITPSGNGCVLLLEDTQRATRVSALEGQYYRAILRNDWGVNHLKDHYGDMWVGGGCRDISVQLPYDRLHLHAGILSRQLRKSVVQDEARACVWSVDEDSEAVTCHEIALAPVRSTTQAGWSVIYDDAILRQLKHIRELALPNETGGIVLGLTDFASRTIVLVEVLGPPADSQASPSHFVRGKAGQEEALQEVHRRTAGLVDYVGEWHSHPRGYPATASADDHRLLETMSDLLSSEGLPVVMLIVADQEVSIHVR
jgi:integrative and conjugative element protein (TIGR02256 family)